MKIYHFGVELQSQELNPVLRKTAMILSDRYCLQEGRFGKSAVRISKFLEEII